MTSVYLSFSLPHRPQTEIGVLKMWYILTTNRNVSFHYQQLEEAKRRPYKDDPGICVTLICGEVHSVW